MIGHSTVALLYLTPSMVGRKFKLYLGGQEKQVMPQYAINTDRNVAVDGGMGSYRKNR